MANDPESGNAYISNLEKNSSLLLLQEVNIKRAFTERGDYGLFRLMYTPRFADKIVQRTNSTGKLVKPINSTELNNLVALQLAMSLVWQGEMAEYWSNDPWKGQSMFRSTMSRNRFMEIRGNIRFTSLDDQFSTPANKLIDPMWHSRPILNELQERCQVLAVPGCISALDENSCATRARTEARSYIPSKPDQYAIRFYCVVEHTTRWLHTVFDNGSGNKSQMSAAERYINLFPDLRKPVHRVFGDVIEKKTVLWAAMIAQQNQRCRAPFKKRVVVMDNFYTSVGLARTLDQLTDGEIKIIGTIKMNMVQGINRENVKQAETLMKNGDAHEWYLIRAYHKRALAPSKKRKSSGKSGSSASKATFEWVVTPNTGFIVWKDKKDVIFLSSDLRQTPSVDIQMGTTTEALFCVRGTVEAQRWLGNESFHRTTIKVPSFVAIYNNFMGAVDRMDQVRAMNPTKRAEKRVSLSIFTWFLDLCINNAFAMRTELRNRNENVDAISFREFKWNIVKNLVGSTGGNAVGNMNDQEEQHGNNHVILDSNGHKLRCLLCSARGMEKRVLQGCLGCQRGFHSNCFTIYHRPDLFKNEPEIQEAVQKAKHLLSSRKNINRPSISFSPTLGSIKLPN